MVDKKVSDKVVWEEGVTSDNDFTPTASQSQFAFQPMSQPQMMFCYKCIMLFPLVLNTALFVRLNYTYRALNVE